MDRTYEDARRILEKLSKQLKDADVWYYQHDDPILTDGVYDDIKKRFLALREKFPDIPLDYDISNKVSGYADEGSPSKKHLAPMYSLDNVFSKEEFDAWTAKVCKQLGIDSEWGEVFTMVDEPKYDGLSINLLYEDGELRSAATRGDGLVGEDVTVNARMIDDIPNTLKGNYPRVIEIRAEVVIPTDEFEKVNADRVAKGWKPFKTPRNAAAGTMRQMDPDVVVERKLGCLAYGKGWSTGLTPQTQAGFLQKLREWGFRTLATGMELIDNGDCHNMYETAMGLRSTYWCDVDGVVFKINEESIQKKLGFTGRVPKWAIAWKFPAQEHLTTLVGIDIQVGRTGALTPVAILTPVNIDGVIVSKATLHNADEIARKDLRIGDTISLIRSGDVIPKITGFVDDGERDTRTKFVFPTKCPSCGTPVVKDESMAVTYCPNETGCPAQAIERIVHYASRKALDIDGLGDEVIATLFHEGFIKDVADIYTLSDRMTDLKRLPGWGELSVHRLLKSIQKSTKTTLTRLIFGLGIENIGLSCAADLAFHVKTFGGFVNLICELKDWDPQAEESLMEIPNFGKARIESLKAYGTAQTIDVLERLEQYLDIEEPIEIKEGPLVGKKVVFTGSLPMMSRNEAQVIAKSLGATVRDSVTKSIDIVVLGDGSGLKEKKARKLGLTIYTPDQWMDLVDKHRTGV